MGSLLTSEADELLNVTEHEVSFGVATKWDLFNSVRSRGTEIFIILGFDFDWDRTFELLGRGPLIVIIIAACPRILGSRIATARGGNSACVWIAIVVLGNSSESIERVFNQPSSF